MVHVNGPAAFNVIALHTAEAGSHFCLDGLPEPHIIIIGERTGKEVVEVLIKRTLFCIEGSERPKWLLPAFFYMNVFGFGVNLYAHLRIAFDTNKSGQGLYHVDTECFDLLRKLEYKDTVSVRIYWPSMGNPQRRVFRVLDALSGWLYNMYNSGLKIDCSMKIGSTVVYFWHLIGISMADFAEFKASCPEDVSLDQKTL